MQTIYRGKVDAIEAVAIRLMALVIAVMVTLILVGSAAGIGRHGVQERVPSSSAGPSLCRLDGHRVPCS